MRMKMAGVRKNNVGFHLEFRCFETQRISMSWLRNEKKKKKKIAKIADRGRLYNDRKRFPSFLRSDSHFYNRLNALGIYPFGKRVASATKELIF